MRPTQLLIAETPRQTKSAFSAPARQGANSLLEGERDAVKGGIGGGIGGGLAGAGLGAIGGIREKGGIPGALIGALAAGTAGALGGGAAGAAGGGVFGAVHGALAKPKSRLQELLAKLRGGR